MNSSLIYGLLAHSHDWKDPGSTPLSNIHNRLIEEDQKQVHHPREMLDVLCVADLGTWCSHKTSRFPIGYGIEAYNHTPTHAIPLAFTSFMAPIEDTSKPELIVTPIGRLLFSLMYKMAWEDPIFRPFAVEFQQIGVGGGSQGTGRPWNFGEIFSEQLQDDLQLCITSGYKPRPPWDEWDVNLP